MSLGSATVEDQGEELVLGNLFQPAGQLWTGSDRDNADLLNMLGIDADTKRQRAELFHSPCSVWGARAGIENVHF